MQHMKIHIDSALERLRDEQIELHDEIRALKALEKQKGREHLGN
jgi:hypothetical protein